MTSRSLIVLLIAAIFNACSIGYADLDEISQDSVSSEPTNGDDNILEGTGEAGTLTEEDLNTLYQTVDEWCEATQGRCCKYTVKFTPVTWQGCKKLTKHACYGAAYIGKNEVFLTLSHIKTQEFLHRIALHEMGHICGLKDSKDSQDLMYSPPQVDEISDNDLAAFNAKFEVNN